LVPRPSIDYASHGIEALSGLDRSSVAPSRLLRLVTRADRRRLVSYLRDGTRWRERIELHITRPDASASLIEAWLAPELGAEGIPVGLEIVVRCIDHADDSR
jgi:hypothetical protein